jgi:ABC-type lipoprotein release transport system permease subunit
MNPLSPLIYHLRHRRSTLLLMALVCLATMGLYVMVAVLDSIPMRAQFIYQTKASRVYPASGDGLEPGVVAQIETHPDVARVIPDNGLSIARPTLIGTEPLRLMGVSQEDARYLMAHYGVRLKEGRMLEPRTNEIVLSEEVVRSLGLELGDEIERSVDDQYFETVPAPLKLVGILERDPAVNPGPSVRVGFASHEYLQAHELFAASAPGLLVVAREGRQEEVEAFLETEIESTRTETDTFREESRFVEMARQMLYGMFGVVNCLVAVVVALVVGVINRIALLQRVEEMGLLHAVGYPKKRLVNRLTLETAVVTAVGWGGGLGLALLFLFGLKVSFYYAKGMELDLANGMPFWFVLPIPLVVIIFANVSIRRIFARLDSIAIIERGKLSEEQKGRKQTARSSIKPLSSLTFYLRHRRRGIMLVLSMALMTLGVAFPVFLLSASLDAMRPGYEYLRYFGQVSPAVGDSLDPGVAAQIRSHPVVERAIPTISMWLQVLVPPGGGASVNIYGVSEADMPVLVDLVGEQLVEGRLPRPRSNEIVISQAAAMNRGLKVGDAVGQPVQERTGEDNPLISDGIPIEMEIVGLLSRDDVWLGFASREYLESHELTASRGTGLLVVPVEGHGAELDAWLEESVASAQTNVVTYSARTREFRNITLSMFVLFALVEGLIAVVAAIALAALNYIFFAQRREEFGVLHAIGRSRPWLVFRTVKETGSTVGLAWLIGAVVCLLGLIGFQALVYTPRGLNLDLFNLVPWMFTLPIPLVVVLIGAGTIARTLRRLDPVAVIERR